MEPARGTETFEARKRSSIFLLRTTGKIKVAILQKNENEKAKDTIQEMDDPIAKGKQKTQIADTSKAGWMTIHLQKRERASISKGDQKRVAGAEEAAEEIENRKKLSRSTSPRRNHDGS